MNHTPVPMGHAMGSWSADRIKDDTYRTKFIDVPNTLTDWLRDHGGLAGRDVLDFGCGEATAALAIALRHGARRVVGIVPLRISEPILTLLKRFGSGRKKTHFAVLTFPACGA